MWKKKKSKNKKMKRYKEMMLWKKCIKLAESFHAKKAGTNRETAAKRRSRQHKERWTLWKFAVDMEHREEVHEKVQRYF